MLAGANDALKNAFTNKLHAGRILGSLDIIIIMIGYEYSRCYFLAAAERNLLSCRCSSSMTVFCTCASSIRPSFIRVTSRRKLQSEGNRSCSGTLRHELEIVCG
jgi:hypothetical protein